MILSHCHFSWQAQYFVRVLKCGSAIFVEAAQGIVRLQGVAEVTFCGRRSILRVLDGTRKFSWQAQGVVWRGWNRETAWQGCLMCVLRRGFPLDFWRKSRTKRSFWRP